MDDGRLTFAAETIKLDDGRLTFAVEVIKPDDGSAAQLGGFRGIGSPASIGSADFAANDHQVSVPMSPLLPQDPARARRPPPV